LKPVLTFDTPRKSTEANRGVVVERDRTEEVDRLAAQESNARMMPWTSNNTVGTMRAARVSVGCIARYQPTGMPVRRSRIAEDCRISATRGWHAAERNHAAGKSDQQSVNEWDHPFRMTEN